MSTIRCTTHPNNTRRVDVIYLYTSSSMWNTFYTKPISTNSQILVTMINFPISRDITGNQLVNYFSQYVGDWITSIALLTAASYLEYFTEPFYRQFNVTDPTINFPFATSQQFDNTRLFTYSIVFPLMIFTVWHVVKWVKLYRDTSKASQRHELSWKLLHSYHILMLSFMAGLALNGFVTEFFKNLIAKPRPDFIERCGVNYELLKPNKVNYDNSICLKPLGQALFKDGFKSSPSGHSSFAFTGLGYLSLWLAGQLKVLRRPSPRRENGKERPAKYIGFYIRLIPLAPLLVASKIAISRTQDYRHHFKDILLGSLIGGLNCCINYFWYFNRLDDELSDELIIDTGYKSALAVAEDESMV